MRDKLIEQIQTLIMPVFEELSAELIELNMKRQGKTVVVDVVADKIGGGITIDECTFLNKEVVKRIEQEQWFGEDYTVEVSSPGLDRALKTSRDFMRVVGRKIRVHLREPVKEKVEHMGELKEAYSDQIVIQAKDKIVTIPLGVIAKAVQVIE